MKIPDITFHVEPPDPSVGIMSEDFSAWETNGKYWCRISDISSSPEDTKFEWFENESGEQVLLGLIDANEIKHQYIIESFLFAFAEQYYKV